jgi:hypothetical protein
MAESQAEYAQPGAARGPESGPAASLWADYVTRLKARVREAAVPGAQALREYMTDPIVRRIFRFGERRPQVRVLEASGVVAGERKRRA